MHVRDALFRLYWALERIIVPGLRYSQYLYEDVLGSQLDHRTLWLDVGCGHNILPPWRAQQEKQLVEKSSKVIGIDADLQSLSQHPTIRLRIAGDISRLPFRDESFSLVTANMVVEHLEAPGVQFAEISRVLRPGGVFLVHTPNRRSYSTRAAMLVPEPIKKRLAYLLEGRTEGDVFKTFYRANTTEEIACLAATVGLDVREIRLIVSSAELVALPPLVLFELVWIRLLMMKVLKRYRTNIIAILQKDATRVGA
jgi:ubiquinone/menaquinone biosynthesis C-methylase UbiE